jgi:hypothetical protein
MSEIEKNTQELTSTIEQALKEAGMTALPGLYRTTMEPDCIGAMGTLEQWRSLLQAKYTREDVEGILRMAWSAGFARGQESMNALDRGQPYTISPVQERDVNAIFLSRLEGK